MKANSGYNFAQRLGPYSVALMAANLCISGCLLESTDGDDEQDDDQAMGETMVPNLSAGTSTTGDVAGTGTGTDSTSSVGTTGSETSGSGDSTGSGTSGGETSTTGTAESSEDNGEAAGDDMGEAGVDSEGEDQGEASDEGSGDDAGDTGDDHCPSGPNSGTVVWSQDFESDGTIGDWSVEGGMWSFGEPTHDIGPSALCGNRVAGTVLDGPYPGTNSTKWGTLVSPVIDVPEAEEFPRLRFWQWYSIGPYDGGHVVIRTSGGNWTGLHTVYTDSEDQWSQGMVYLGAYAGQRVQIGFQLASQYENTHPGWFIDEVSLETGPMDTSPQTFEDGWGDWSIEGGVWAVGTSTDEFGPEAPHGGTSLAGTVLSGPYPGFNSTTYARLISPLFEVPKDVNNAKIRMWYWYELGAYDWGSFQIRVDDGPWTTVPSGDISGDGGDAWAQRIIDVTAYEQKHVQVGLLLRTQYENDAPGWFIDDVSIEID